jgi:hypothetical protein
MDELIIFWPPSLASVSTTQVFFIAGTCFGLGWKTWDLIRLHVYKNRQ